MIANLYSLAYIDKVKQYILKGKDKDEIINEVANDIMNNHNNIDKDTAVIAAKLAYARAVINIYQSSHTEEHEDNTDNREHEGSAKSIRYTKKG
jgi:hypothetical protein